MRHRSALIASCLRSSLGLGLGLSLAIACGPGPGPKPPRHNVSCPDGTSRPTIDCQTDLGLRERVVAANASLGTTGIGIGGKYEERAVGQVTDSTYQLALRLESVCKDYNACVVSADTYSTQAQTVREQLTHHVAMVDGLSKGVTAQLGDEIWSNAVPQLASQRVAMDMRLEASSGGRTIVHDDGAPLTSGDKFRVVVRPTVTAYVYILLLSSSGEPSVLFPNPDMPLANPLPGGQEVAIPNDGAFELDKVKGEEHLQVLASSRPLPDLELRLKALAAGGAPPKQPEQGVLGGIGDLLCDSADGKRGIKYTKSAVACAGNKVRGVIYKKAAGAAQKLVARPGDDVIVYQHRIDHR
ncbi:MAG: DUF4384 domain-containing protein [Deltaproteobacteria bacterium]|nr:DUF4384 domain-containing protein [Nannocystaceae bacterium]